MLYAVVLATVTNILQIIANEIKELFWMKLVVRNLPHRVHRRTVVFSTLARGARVRIRHAHRQQRKGANTTTSCSLRGIPIGAGIGILSGVAKVVQVKQLVKRGNNFVELELPSETYSCH